MRARWMLLGVLCCSSSCQTEKHTVAYGDVGPQEFRVDGDLAGVGCVAKGAESLFLITQTQSANRAAYAHVTPLRGTSRRDQKVQIVRQKSGECIILDWEKTARESLCLTEIGGAELRQFRGIVRSYVVTGDGTVTINNLSGDTSQWRDRIRKNLFAKTSRVWVSTETINGGYSVVTTVQVQKQGNRIPGPNPGDSTNISKHQGNLADLLASAAPGELVIVTTFWHKVVGCQGDLQEWWPSAANVPTVTGPVTEYIVKGK